MITATLGRAGLELASEREPDLIVLDLNLPAIHGKDVLARLQPLAITRGIPVVVISAGAIPNQMKHVLSAGARAYLTKPLDVEQFLRTLDSFRSGNTHTGDTATRNTHTGNTFTPTLVEQNEESV